MIIDSGWRKSSHCDSGTCVEVKFVKATQSDVDHCVEVGFCDCEEQSIHVRDSKNPTGPVLRFTLDEWRAFVGGAQDGEFDVS